MREQLVDERLAEVVERQQNNGDVVQSFVGDGVLHDLLYDVAADLVDGLVLVLEVPLSSYPRLLDHFLVRDFVENSVAYQKSADVQKYLHPSNKKSILSSIWNSLMSGFAITTLGFPPYFSRLASMSPKVLETLRRPGKTRKGP